MVIDDRFYVGGLSDRTVMRLVRRLRRFPKTKYTPLTYVVTLPLFHDGILEIYDVYEFTQSAYRDIIDSIHIVGVAPTRFQAMLLVRDIIDDIYQKTGGVDVPGFFSSPKAPA